MENIIESRNIQYQYPYHEVLIKGVDLKLAPGKILGVLGKNGAGKTTLVNLFMGIKKPVKGELRVLGKDPFRDKKVLLNMAFCSHDIHLSSEATVGEQIDYYLSPFKHKSNERLNYYLGVFGLERHQKIHSLSTGERAKVQIISCFLREIKLLIVDEITAVLDIESRLVFFRELKKLCQQKGLAVVIATNLIEDLEGYADQVLFVDKHNTSLNHSHNLVSLFTRGKAA